MKKLYSTLSVDVVKFEAQDVITASGAVTTQKPAASEPPYSTSEPPYSTSEAPATTAEPSYAPDVTQ
ncbi:MAG: hypothetical protein MR636_00740 [Clostridiales bacterium]|nr:hypothetical protein [Clostridiales bacterium]